MIRLWAVGLLTVARLAGQAVPICSVVTVDDARKFLGPTAREGRTQAGNGLGDTAFSTVHTAHQGGRAAIHLLKDSAILAVDINGFAPGGAEERLPQVRELVSKLVPKL